MVEARINPPISLVLLFANKKSLTVKVIAPPHSWGSRLARQESSTG